MRHLAHAVVYYWSNTAILCGLSVPRYCTCLLLAYLTADDLEQSFSLNARVEIVARVRLLITVISFLKHFNWLCR